MQIFRHCFSIISSKNFIIVFRKCIIFENVGYYLHILTLKFLFFKTIMDIMVYCGSNLILLVCCFIYCLQSFLSSIFSSILNLVYALALSLLIGSMLLVVNFYL